MPRFARLAYYSTSFSFCQGVLQKFFQLFSRLFRAALNFGGSARLLYHISFHLSRGFSKVFSTFFVIFCLAAVHGVPLVDSLLSCRQPAYYSTSPSVCQVVFTKFLRFGIVGSLTQFKAQSFMHFKQWIFFSAWFSLDKPPRIWYNSKNGNFLYPVATILSVFSSI